MAADVARGLLLRMDHGSQYLSDHFVKQVKFYGIHVLEGTSVQFCVFNGRPLCFPSGLIGMEIKSRSMVSEKDARSLKAVAEALPAQWRCGLVLYTGSRIMRLAAPDIWAIPSRRLFQPAG